MALATYPTVTCLHCGGELASEGMAGHSAMHSARHQAAEPKPTSTTPDLLADVYLGSGEVAALLSVSGATVKRWVRNDKRLSARRRSR